MAGTTNPKANKQVKEVISLASAAKVVSVTDEAANILLTIGDKEMVLLKLTAVPFHKDYLPSVPESSSLTDEVEKNANAIHSDNKQQQQQQQQHSQQVMEFLHKFDWNCTSESGAEYSYHDASLKLDPHHHQESTNDDDIQDPMAKKPKLMKKDDAFIFGRLKAELIFPASERQIARVLPSPDMAMVSETPEMYTAIVKPMIKENIASGSLSWLKNIVELKKEKERLLHNGQDWILNIDTKWRTHPDALTVPRSEWYQHESVVDLYCLGILKAEGVATLRDLTAEHHLPVLRDMLRQGPKVIEQVYGVKRNQLRIFVHYHPQFYHFHVHFTRLENETGAQVEKAHLVSDIIQNLEMDPEYYQNKTLSCKLYVTNDLYKRMETFGT